MSIEKVAAWPAYPRVGRSPIEVYTDGSCIRNPGKGGWAAIIVVPGNLITTTKKTKLHGRSRRNTTNNRMELMAAIKGLEATPEGSSVRLHSDSKYIVSTMTMGWKRKRNLDLWGMLDKEASKRTVEWIWVRAHSGNPMNEEADRLAYAEATNRSTQC